MGVLLVIMEKMVKITKLQMVKELFLKYKEVEVEVLLINLVIQEVVEVPGVAARPLLRPLHSNVLTGCMVPPCASSLSG